MTGEEAIAYLEGHSWSKKKLGLDREKRLLAAWGDPQRQLKCIHVAGSNGKGSTCAMFDSVLRAAGYKVGLFTSPHIEDFCERIQVNGVPIDGAALAALTREIMPMADAMEDTPTLFELVTAIGLTYFARQKCDIVVLEVGMGGAFDSTNAIDAPVLAVITNIGLEHTEYLGSTLEEIAGTKAGIIKPGSSCVCYDGAPEVTQVIRQACKARNVPFALTDIGQMERLSFSLNGQDIAWRGQPYHLGLLGEHQTRNAAVVLTGLEKLREQGFSIPPQAIAQGLAQVTWPARLEILSRQPLFILDGGHNPQCAEAMAGSLAQLFPGEKFTFLMGVLADKDHGAMLDILLPMAKGFVCVSPQSPRGLAPQELCDYLHYRGAKAVVCDTIREGIRTALAQSQGGVTVGFGSLYLAGDIRRVFREIYDEC